LSEEFADAIRHPGTVAYPVVDSVALEVECCGGGAGVVGTDDFDGPSIAGAIFFNDNDAVVGLPTRARRIINTLGNPLEKRKRCV
jgi:hypothetical protein